jgi:1,4-dihydroxy-2-naphthoate octaprenyltransferase
MEPTLAAFQNPLTRYFAATRPAFVTASLMFCLLGLALAWHDGTAFDIPLALVTLLFALMAHAGINMLNDYYDALNGTDAQNTERIFPFTGGSRFIQNSVLTLAQTRNFDFALLAGVAAGILSITVGADFVQRKGFAAAPFITGLSYALLATNLLYINQFPDRTANTAAGKLHWVARLPMQHARWGYVLLMASAYAWLLLSVLLGWLPAFALLALLALPLSIKAARLLLKHAAQPQQLGDAIKLTIAALMAHGTLLSLALFFSKGNT